MDEINKALFQIHSNFDSSEAVFGGNFLDMKSQFSNTKCPNNFHLIQSEKLNKQFA